MNHSHIVSQLNLTQIFCEVDDFCKSFEYHCQQQLELSSTDKQKRCRSRMSLSEIMTIVIAFHGSGFRTFKHFYTLCVLPYWRSAFPHLVSYNRFVELMPWSLMLLCCFLETRKGEITGISFVDSTPITVCNNCRAKSHKVFEGNVGWGKNSVGWHFGFKLHLIINDRGELLAFKLTPANTDDRKPIPEMVDDLWGKLFGDKGYISQKLFEELFEKGLKLITKCKRKMKNRLLTLMDKILLRKRALIESVNDQLKNICQIEHSRPRSMFNFMVNLLAGLVAYTYLEKKTSLDLQVKGLSALPSAIF